MCVGIHIPHDISFLKKEWNKPIQSITLTHFMGTPRDIFKLKNKRHNPSALSHKRKVMLTAVQTLKANSLFFKKVNDIAVNFIV